MADSELISIEPTSLDGRCVNMGTIEGADYYYFEFYIDLDGIKQQTGYVQMKVDRRKRRMIWNGFVPLQSLGEQYKRNGLGTAAHVFVLLRMLEKYGADADKYKVYHHHDHSKDRRNHLAAMKLRAGGWYARFIADHMKWGIAEPFPVYLRKSLEFAGSRDIIPYGPSNNGHSNGVAGIIECLESCIQ